MFPSKKHSPGSIQNTTGKPLTAGSINLHWYSGDQAFAQDLLNAAENGSGTPAKRCRPATRQPIHLYIYANTDDMKDAILYEPSWTGGMAYSDHDIVIIGISQRDLEWGRDHHRP